MRARVVSALSLLIATLPASRALAGPTLLFDAEDGAVFYAEDQDNQWHPASLTKIMTAYVTFQAIRDGKLRLDQKIPCSEHAAGQPPSKLGLPVGGELTVEHALKVLIVKSANDVAVMLAEAVGGTEADFVAMMNAEAQRLGMTRTNFVNPNGLPATLQVTTARDLAKLARAAVKDFPEYASYWSMPDVRIGKLRLGSHNSLLGTFEGADGMKTGFICDSGYNLVASATRDGRKLMAVVLGEASGGARAVRAASLLEHGFQQYAWKHMFEPGTIDTTPVAADAKGITSMRELVVSWECGTGRPHRANKARKAKTKKGLKKKPNAADAGGAGAAVPEIAAGASAQAGREEAAADAVQEPSAGGGAAVVNAAVQKTIKPSGRAAPPAAP
jgi:D-alanyl-D-alanine carboxypeptidase